MELGFFKLINHGMDHQLKENFEKMSKSFFDLPFEWKNEVRRELSKKTFRGYYGSGSCLKICAKKLSNLYHQPIKDLVLSRLMVNPI